MRSDPRLEALHCCERRGSARADGKLHRAAVLATDCLGDTCAVILACHQFTAHDAVDAAGGANALHYAAFNDLGGVCATMLASGHFTGANAVDQDGFTALHRAANRGQGKACEALLASDRFTALDAVDYAGNTALYGAAKSGLNDVCIAMFASQHFTVTDAVVGRALGAALSRPSNTLVLRSFVLTGCVTSSARNMLCDAQMDALDAVTDELYAPGGAGASLAAAHFARAVEDGGSRTSCDAVSDADSSGDCDGMQGQQPAVSQTSPAASPSDEQCVSSKDDLLLRHARITVVPAFKNALSTPDISILD